MSKSHPELPLLPDLLACCIPLAHEPMTAEQAAQVAPLLKALADPARLRLLSIVLSHEGGEACVCDLTPYFGLSQPTISHHLKVLHEAGVLDREKRATWVFLPDLPAYRTGLIIVGLARCIAMVLIWNDLACGDREAAAILVALNAVFQILAFALLGYFYLQVLPGWLGLSQAALHVSVWAIARSVLIFLGIPLLAGYLTRTFGERARDRAWYENKLLPRIGPAALYGLLFTVVILFALQGHTITSRPLEVARIAVPLLVYFALMWGGAMVLTRALRFGYPQATAVSFTAAGNNFELAIAVAIGVFGVTSGQALAGVVGPLIEVPALVALVYVGLWARRFFPDQPTHQHQTPTAASASKGGRR